MIPRSEWLMQAQHLCIGQKKRIRHNKECTAAMDIYNNDDSWSCWCHRCKDGGRVWKEHQHVRVARVDEDRVQAVPADALRIRDATPYVQRQIWKLLISKGIGPEVIPEEILWWSPTANRLLLIWQGRALGRALSPLQQPKWLMYGEWAGQPRVWFTLFNASSPVVITEDALSAHKLSHALAQYHTAVSVMSCLGTRLTERALALLIQNQTKQIICMFDGDRAGASGADGVRQRVRPFGIQFDEVVLADGYDPKDLTMAELQALVRSKLNG